MQGSALRNRKINLSLKYQNTILFIYLGFLTESKKAVLTEKEEERKREKKKKKKRMEKEKGKRDRGKGKN